MPILSNAKKALRSSKKKAARNQVTKSKTKNAVDKVKKNPTAEFLAAAYSAIDKAVKNNIFHKNRASRIKTQLSKLVKPAKLEKAVKKAKAPSTKKTATKKTSKK